MAPSHYLNQCKLIIKSALWYSAENNFIRSALEIDPYHAFGNYNFEIILTFSGADELTILINQGAHSQSKGEINVILAFTKQFEHFNTHGLILTAHVLKFCPILFNCLSVQQSLFAMCCEMSLKKAIFSECNINHFHAQVIV